MPRASLRNWSELAECREFVDVTVVVGGKLKRYLRYFYEQSPCLHQMDEASP